MFWFVGQLGGLWITAFYFLICFPCLFLYMIYNKFNSYFTSTTDTFSLVKCYQYSKVAGFDITTSNYLQYSLSEWLAGVPTKGILAYIYSVKWHNIPF